MTKVRWSTETNDIDNRFLRECDNMCKLMEDRQITDYYQAQRQIQSAMMGDTPVKTVQNRQYIDNVSDYDSEHHRISKSVHHKLDLGPISLPGAQQHTTVEAAAALKIQDKTESDFKAHMQNDNSQYKTEIYKRAESIIPQLDGTYNVSDSSDTDSHDYLDLASTNIIQYCYIVRLGLNCKFIDLLFKHPFIIFIKISSHLGFIVSEIIYSQTDTLTKGLMNLR